MTHSESRRKAAVGFIFVTVLLDVLSFGVIIPILPMLIKEFSGGDSSQAALNYGMFATVFAAMHFLFSPLLGALSDRFGRRPILLVSCFGLGVDYVFMALAPSLEWLFVGRILSGITSASFACATAYIADITPPEHRAARFGVIGAAFGLGFVLGPALGGALGAIHLRLPFWTAAGFALANWLYGTLILPESLPKAKRATFSWKRANPVGSLQLISRHPELLGLAGVQMLYFLAHHVLPSSFVLYTNYRYGWSAWMTGVNLAVVGVLNIAVQGFLVRAAVKKFGERLCLLLALGCGVTALILFGVASHSLVLWLALPIFAFMGFFQPSIQGLMTRLVGSHEQGQLQGASGSLQGISGLIGPFLFTSSFSYSISKSHPNWELPGAPFFVAAILLAVALLVVWFRTRPASPVLNNA